MSGAYDVYAEVREELTEFLRQHPKGAEEIAAQFFAEVSTVKGWANGIYLPPFNVVHELIRFIQSRSQTE